MHLKVLTSSITTRARLEPRPQPPLPSQPPPSVGPGPSALNLFGTLSFLRRRSGSDSKKSSQESLTACASTKRHVFHVRILPKRSHRLFCSLQDFSQHEDKFAPDSPNRCFHSRGVRVQDYGVIAPGALFILFFFGWSRNNTRAPLRSSVFFKFFLNPTVRLSEGRVSVRICFPLYNHTAAPPVTLVRLMEPRFLASTNAEGQEQSWGVGE